MNYCFRVSNLVMILSHCAVFCVEVSGDRRDLHVLTHSFPTRRSSDLLTSTSRAALRCSASMRPKLSWPPSRSASCGGSARRCAPRWRATASPWCATRSEEHTSELQSLMRISYAVFCLQKKNKQQGETIASNIRHHITLTGHSDT